MGECIDLTGQKFGLLTVIKREENTNTGNSRWLCKCECGNFITIRGASLRKQWLFLNRVVVYIKNLCENATKQIRNVIFMI